jgi:hypothetical protein
MINKSLTISNVRLHQNGPLLNSKRDHQTVSLWPDVRFSPNRNRKSGFPQKSCLLYPRKRTCAAQ